MNKKLLTAIMTMLIIILLTSGCSAKMSREEYFAALIAQGENFGAVYSDFAAPLSTIDTYSYTLTTYSEYLPNFDYGQRLMPSEYKKWEKINQTLTYIKAGNLEYYKNEIIQPVYDGDNMPVFSDAKCKNPIFADKITFELWLTDGSTTNVKINGTAVTDIENYSVSDFYIVNFDNQPAALFSSNTRNWFGKKLNTAQYYYVKALESTENIPYSLSGNATGYAEDLTFDWQSISNVLILTYGLTEKQNKPQKFEYYTETISAFSKQITQIWNGATVTSWYGDRTAASRTVIEYIYPSKKINIAIPNQ